MKTNIHKMALNEVAEINDSFWRRVPGGWIVTEVFQPLGKTDQLIRLHPVFVPYNKEFSGKQEGSPVDTHEARDRVGAPYDSLPAEEQPTTITRPSRMNDDDDTSPGF